MSTSSEKPSFSQTCSLLSQYLKEKGSFGDLTHSMTCNTDPTGSGEASTMNLFPSTKEANKASQLTIFYGGQVIVFDDVPTEKAKEIMSFATKGNSQSNKSSVYSMPLPLPHPQPPTRPVTRDLPIMRNASLHRFLEKRKDRIAAKAPYQTSKPTGVPSKPVESMPWLGLAANSTQL